MNVITPPVPVADALRRRARLTMCAGLLLGVVGMAVSPAGGPSAALLDVALLALALWLSRDQAGAPAVKTRSNAMTGNQALLLVLALGGAAVLVAAGAAARPLHGLAVAPFGMAAFALSSQNSRDLRSGLLAATAALLVLSAADDRAVVISACAVGLVPLAFSWIAVRQLMALDRFPDLLPHLARPRPRPWSAAAVARVVVLTAAVTLVLPTEPAPRLHAGGSSSSGADQSPSHGARGDGIGGSDGSLDLRARGELDAAPVLEVPEGTPTLWQGSYVDDYEGSAWTRRSNRGARTESYVPLSAATPLPAGPTRTVSDVVRLVKPDGDLNGTLLLVYSPGPVVAVRATSGYLYDLGTGSLAVFDRQNPGLPYSVDWAAPGSTDAGTVSRTRPPVSDPRWVQLPAELPTRVRDLARTITASATTLEAKVVAIETYLRTHEEYRLDSPVPAEGVDAVDAFLFTDHVGFCEQFASAEAVMLRTLGIPARVATGYGGPGVPATDGAGRVYRNQDAHAWVQVGEPGQRWVDSDPTAGSRLGPESAQARITGWLSRLWKAATGTATARRLLAAGILGLAALCWWVGRRLGRVVRRRKAAPGVGLPDPVTDAGRAYQRLLARLAQQNRPRRPTETVRDLLIRLRAREWETVASVLETEWYGTAPAVPEQRAALAVEVLDRLALEAVPEAPAGP